MNKEEKKSLIIVILIAVLLVALSLKLTPTKNTDWMTDDEFNDYINEMQQQDLESYYNN